MFDIKTWLLSGAKLSPALIYCFVLSANCYANEPDEIEGAPIGAMYLTGSASTTTATATTSVTTMIEFRPDMMGDNFIKVVRENTVRSGNAGPNLGPERSITGWYGRVRDSLGNG